MDWNEKGYRQRLIRRLATSSEEIIVVKSHVVAVGIRTRKEMGSINIYVPKTLRKEMESRITFRFWCEKLDEWKVTSRDSKYWKNRFRKKDKDVHTKHKKSLASQGRTKTSSTITKRR